MPPLPNKPPSQNGTGHHAPAGGLAAYLAKRGVNLKPPPVDDEPEPPEPDAPTPSQGSQDRRASEEGAGLIGKVAVFIGLYIALSYRTRVVVAAWVLAAWLSDVWDRFPHLAITSPEKRCGKTRFLQILELLLPNPRSASNISPAAVYRLIAQGLVSLLLDEAQALARRASESTEALFELLCAGIDRHAKVLRMGGKNFDTVMEFAIYCPKVIALIGELCGVLADRCLPVPMRRKTDADDVQPYRSRIVEPLGHALRDEIEAWATANRDRAKDRYDGMEPPDFIANDRMAELLLPLLAVDEADGGHHTPDILEYARELDRKDAEAERMSPGVRLLAACREIFARRVKDSPTDGRFVPTDTLVTYLTERDEEPWATLTRGKPITNEALAKLLRPYGIKSVRNRKQTARGYVAADFAEAWSRYLPAPPK